MGSVIAFPGISLAAIGIITEAIGSRQPDRVRVFEDVFGDFGVEMPVADNPATYAYGHFPTAEAAREAARRIARRNFWMVVDETLPDVGGAA